MKTAIRTLAGSLFALTVLVGCGAPNNNNLAISGNCLQGTWSASTANLTSYMQNVITVMQPNVTAGTFSLAFNNGSFSQKVDNMTIKSTISDQILEVSTSGETNGTYEEKTPGTINFHSNGTGTTKVNSMTLNGQPMNAGAAPIDFKGIFAGEQTNVSYQCSANNLALTFTLPASAVAPEHQAVMMLSR